MRFPLGRLTVVTGVSGSGKSTLARDVLRENLERLVGRRGIGRPLLPCSAANRFPAGRACRACWKWTRRPSARRRPVPRDHVGLLRHDPEAVADTQEACIRGYTASRFSFNRGGEGEGQGASKAAPDAGRCAACEGEGIKTIEMSFLPDVKVLCEACGGARFNPETLPVMRGTSVGEVLTMSVDEAVEFFTAHPSIHHALRLLQDVGLGYLTLGSKSHAFRREAQRIKLVTELAKVRSDSKPRAAPSPPHALRARRAHRRPAHGGRREADPRSSSAGGRR